ncbi:MAG: lipid A phosphoethanolamine transferase [Odoribacter sp.]|nr:lipid A phosphoethanolamine transferase [Odoribacter sp.]
MKHFNKRIFEHLFSSTVLMWAIPCVLVIPNIILDITDYSNWLEKVVNILLPAGIYLLLVSLSRNVGRTVLFMFPFVFYAAFQVVLLYLYGESIIAVDMFLNLVTTNVSEATELLGNLSLAIITVIVLYLVPVIWAVVLIWRRSRASSDALLYARRAGIYVTVAGLVAMVAAYLFVPRFELLRDVFPFNVFSNTVTAVQRTIATNNYYKTSAAYDHHARSSRPTGLKEVYVLVIGETSRADNWQLAGYDRQTNPRLSKRSSVVFYGNVLSQSNTTHKSVPLIMSPLSVETFNDSICYTKGILSAFNQAGYNTAFISNQSRNHSFIDFFAREAQVMEFLNDDGMHHYDMELLPRLKDFIKNSSGAKLFVVLHTYGSHFNYTDRYTPDFEVFMPDNKTSANRDNRPQLINSYDNTIRYTDAVLDSVISTLESLECPAALVYLSDHGEDIFDDNRNRFLHASPVPTYYQIHVPMILWTSREFDALYSDKSDLARKHARFNVASNDVAYHTLLDLAGVKTSDVDYSKSLVNASYRDLPRRYLNDYNEGVALEAAGLRTYDYDQLHKKGISAK